MRNEPPAGNDLEAMLDRIKDRVLITADSTPQKRHRFHVAPFVIGASALLLIGGTGAAIATGALESTVHPIPMSTNRIIDPPPPGDYDQADNSALTPQEAPIGQLYAILDSGLRRADSGAAPWNPSMMTDFADAITTRCYPQLAEADIAALEAAKASYASLAANEGLAAGHQYVDRAAALCM
jgi:hypothetical protein